MTNALRGGSSASARDLTPSLQLAKLASLVAKALPVAEGGLAGMSFFQMDGNTLRLNTRGVVHRLLTHPSFEQEFEPGIDTGFIRDIELPPYGSSAKLGGRLLTGSEPATTAAVEKLLEVIRGELDTAMQDKNYGALTIPSLEEALATFAASVDEKAPELPKKAVLQPIQFATTDRKSDERTKDVARVFSAIEIIDGRDWLDVLLSGISKKLQNEGQDDDVIDEVVSAIQAQRTRPGSQIRQFLDFLDDEALSRVRLQVTMQLMEAVAAQTNRPGLKSYVRRVRECFHHFAGISAESLLLDASAVYGMANNVDFGEYLQKALFYYCLPVWAEWSVQLFETRLEPHRGVATMREVSYRFRVNGQNPQSGESAMLTRINRLYERLLANPNNEQNVKKAIAEIVFLYLVLPSSMGDDEQTDIRIKAQKIAQKLKVEPVKTLTILHERLLGRANVMEDIATDLINILKEKSRNLVDVVNRQVEKFTVSLNRNIINWDAIDSLTSSKTNILVSSEKGPDSISWFHHLVVSQAPIVQGSIASYSVQTELRERALTPAGDPEHLILERDLSSSLLPVRMIPYQWDKKEMSWEPALPNADAFRTGTGVQIEYDLHTLRLQRVKPEQRPRSEQLRTAVLAAITLMIYVALWEIARRTARESVQPLSMLILRLQISGKKADREDDANDGNTAIYSISQALEKALSRDIPVKLQGLTSDGPASTYRWKKKGTLAALLGSQPVKFTMSGNVDKIALIAYVTRPCDMHPGYADADGFLYISRTYKAVSDNGVATLRFDNMNSQLVDTRKEFNTPHGILAEIASLRAEGFQHIILLSHHFGNRHIGRAAERHSPHGTFEFMGDAAKRFPDVFLYSMRRDVFPATRLRRRQSHESAFEVVSFKDHIDMYDEIAKDLLRSTLPIYTFATLSVIDEELRPQSGFCTYFFDVDQRLTEIGEVARQNVLGTGANVGVRKSLIDVLRAVHFMESEKPADKSHLLPVLDPFSWAAPVTTAAAGEVEIMSRRGGRRVLLSIPAMLTHVTKILHKDPS